jgi:hypothetical protein
MPKTHPPFPEELVGWKSIGAYLRVSVRTAQEFEKIRGLPVHRGSGVKAPVFALRAELEDWSRSCSVKQRPDEEVVVVSPDVFKPQPPQRFLRRNRMWWALAAVLAVASIIFATIWHQAQPNDIKIQGNSVIAVDLKGREIWRHVFPWVLRETDYTLQERFVHYWLGDLKGDGERQLVFGTLPYNTMADGTPVFCFRADGRVRWQFVPGHSVVDGSGDNMLPPYFANTVRVVQGKRPADTRIVISSNHYMNQANQVAFLDVNGKVVGEYWHPGHLIHLEQADLDGDGRKELLLGGVNNGDHQATLVVLDPLKISGSVTPKEMRDHRFELLGMPAANERAVLLFPRSCISTGQPYTRVQSVHVSKDRILVAVAENTEEDSPLGFVYELDYRLNVVNVEPTNGVLVAKAHHELEVEGKLDHPIDFRKELVLLKAGVVVRRGN